MFLYSKPGRKLGTESLKQQQQEKPRLPVFGSEEATAREWRRQRIRKRGGSKAQSVLGERASERADRACWRSHEEPIEEVLARFAHAEFGKLLQGKLDSACMCTWMVEAPSSRARQEMAPFCLQVHVPNEAPHYEIDEG